MIRVFEIFKSFQGEGPRSGRPTIFIRLSGCNLACKWCDTKDSWNSNNSVSLCVQDIMSHSLIEGRAATNVCITGGEPLIQQSDPEFILLLMKLQDHFTVELETNGTIMPTRPTMTSITQLNVSPKLRSTGSVSPVNMKILRDIFHDRWNTIVYKFVVDPLHLGLCLDEIQSICDEACIDDDSVWLMPLGVKREEIIMNTTLLMNSDHPYNVSSRNHIIFNQR